MSPTRTPAAKRPAAKAAPKKPVKRQPPDPAKAWAKRLARTRPYLVPFVLDALAARYGEPVWARVHEPYCVVVLTMLSQ
jgi:hypothetical protein